MDNTTQFFSTFYKSQESMIDFKATAYNLIKEKILNNISPSKFVILKMVRNSCDI